MTAAAVALEPREAAPWERLGLTETEYSDLRAQWEAIHRFTKSTVEALRAVGFKVAPGSLTESLLIVALDGAAMELYARVKGGHAAA